MQHNQDLIIYTQGLATKTTPTAPIGNGGRKTQGKLMMVKERSKSQTLASLRDSPRVGILMRKKEAVGALLIDMDRE
ncbi:hypothetical protein TcasGA2_TC031388 [Tribolium castaneum]|uniref:Uncharacterized protein n=1 Tax=Tribolium castaneum TaxID=7070 RepID=A0A139WAB0_TRICA|nr:hypothetical protein TcasGA2_TC031388 [Tribolium castaneum]